MQVVGSPNSEEKLRGFFLYNLNTKIHWNTILKCLKA